VKLKKKKSKSRGVTVKYGRCKMLNKKSLRSEVSALDSWLEHDEALGYRLTFVRSEASVTDSNSLTSNGRVHKVYKKWMDVWVAQHINQKDRGRPPEGRRTT